jgi:hypothetical protein
VIHEEELLKRIETIFAGNSTMVTTNQPVIFDLVSSCPFLTRHVTKCPDVMQLLQLHHRGHFDLKVVLLHRDPTAAVLSALRRGFTKDLGLQLRTVEFSLSHLESVLRAVPCQHMFLLPYPLLTHRPVDLARQLAGFLGSAALEETIATNVRRDGWEASREPDLAKLASVVECSGRGLKAADCQELLVAEAHRFFQSRLGLWPLLGTLLGHRPARDTQTGGHKTVPEHRSSPALFRHAHYWN